MTAAADPVTEVPPYPKPAAGDQPSRVPTVQRHYWFPGMAAGPFVFTALPAGSASARRLADARQCTLRVPSDARLEALWESYRVGGCAAPVLADALDERRPAETLRSEAADWDRAMALLRS